METYIKLYDSILSLDLPWDERIALALIRQMTEPGDGFWAGYKTLADRLHIPKSRCKAIIQHLAQIGAVEITHETILKKSRIVIRTKTHFFDKK